MKIEQEKSFKPVVITLETQEEVDKIFAMFNHVTLSETLEFDLNWTDMLELFSSDEYKEYHRRLTNIIK